MDNIEREVDFNHYCETCKHEKLAEHEAPCDECLSNPTNTESHKPVYWKTKE